jgi:hypothetical protein
MSLQRDVIQSGNLSLRGYKEDGVFYQCAPVRELARYVAGGNNASFPLNFQVLLKCLIVHYPTTPSGTVSITFEGDSLTYNVTASGTDFFFTALPMYPVVGGTLQVQTSANADKMVLVCERVGVL